MKFSDIFAILNEYNTLPCQLLQVSWTEDSKLAKKGQHNIRIFDEEGYAALRKALRGNEPTSSVSEFFNVAVKHPGAYNGPWLRSEFVAVVISLLVSYFAVTTKAKIVS